MAFDFDGTNDWFDVGGTTSFDNLTALTCAAWVNLDDDTADQAIFQTTGGGDLILFFDDVGSLSGRTNIATFFVRDANNDSVKVEGATNSLTASGGWTHVTGTFVAASATGCRLYIDGVEDANSPSDATLVAGTENTGTLRVGANPDNSDDLNGQLAEMAIWNRALSAGEAAALGAGYAPSFFPSGLLFYWPAVRQQIDRAQGLTMTANGTPSAVAHPRIINPAPRSFWSVAAAAAGLVPAPHYLLAASGDTI